MITTKKLLFRGLVMGIILVAGAASGAFCEEKWQEYRGQHFIIYYKDVPEDFVKTVEQTAEGYYEEITRNLGFSRYKNWSWDERAKIYIYRDAQDYTESSKQPGWSAGAAAARDRIIRTFPSAHGFFDSTLPHELGHIIFREFIGFNADIPVWVDEGVAMYQEKARRWGANKIVKKTIEDKQFIPLGELSQIRFTSETSRELVDLFYTEAASVIYYLIADQGEYKFVNFCRKLKDGDTFEQALAGAYYRFKNVDELNRAWVEYLR